MKTNKQVKHTVKRKVKRKSKQELKSIGRFIVAGVVFSDYHSAKLKVGAAVTVLHERANKFDSKALKLLVGNVSIGYVPRGDLQSGIHLRYNQGCSIVAKITGYHKNNPTWRMLTVEVWHTHVQSENATSLSETLF